jgi:tRNA threonylcarbamoyladenosine biosynthesis protein TsaB
MLVLAIDTCGPEGSIALGRVTEEKMERIGQATLAGKTYSSQLMPAIRALLEESRISLAELGCLAVVHGPGSFTGVRVGLSTAKGLAEARSLPVVGVSRLQVLAQKAAQRAAVLDAGRGEVYFGIAGDSGSELLLTREQVQERTAEADLACCEEKVAEAFPAATRVAAPTAADALEFAQSLIRNRNYHDIGAMDAHYLRRSEAEVVAAAREAAVDATLDATR